MDLMTFFSGSVAGGLLVYFGRTLLENCLAKERSALDRKAIGAREFRDKVNEALALFQKPEENWGGNNRTANAMRNFVSAIDLSAKDYAGLCAGTEKTEFLSKWQETRNYCSSTLPRAMTSNSQTSAQDAKPSSSNMLMSFCLMQTHNPFKRDCAKARSTPTRNTLGLT